jgi:hypothetical protein
MTKLSKPSSYLAELIAKLTPAYIAQGCHDLPHVLRMEAMYPEIVGFFPDLDEEQFRIAVWLHNLDRCTSYKKLVKEMGLELSLHSFMGGAMRPEQFLREIVTAVLEHSKFLDGPNDSALLHGLRLADKWDRIGILGGISSFQWLGCVLPAYDTTIPFGYGSTAEGDLAKSGKGGYGTLYQSMYRVLEWYPTFPLIRDLVKRHPWRFKHFLLFLRGFAMEVAEAHGVPNTVEDDIRRCLGEHYVNWLPPE